MRDIYLRFADAEEMRRSLLEFGFDRSGDGEIFHHLIAIDVVGSVTVNIGTEEAPEFKTLPGWHVNLRVTDALDISALKNYAIIPKNPVRVWA